MKSFPLTAITLALLFLITACTSTQQSTNEAAPTVTPLAAAPTLTTCTSFAVVSEAETTTSAFPPVTVSDHVYGPEEAPVTIMMYGDLQSDLSGLLTNTVTRMLDENPGQIRFVSRVFPLVGQNNKAVLAAQAVEGASEQNMFWELHNLLYSQQQSWVNLSPEDFEQWLAAQASALGMNLGQFQADLKSDAIFDRLKEKFDEAQDAGVFGVPLVAINGEIYMGPQDYGSMNEIVQLILLGERHFTYCPPMLIQKTKQYIATLHTEKGDVVIQLFADKAPFTVNSFVFLAQNGWYDNITFHRVIPDVYAQSGDPSGTGKGTPGYFVTTEILPELTFDSPGMVAMVNSGTKSSNGQFFINYESAPQFNGQYTIFGQVLSGMDVLASLTPRDAQPGVETPPGDKLLGIDIEER